MNKKQMSEQDIRSKFITPAIVKGCWDLLSQIREEVTFTQGKVIVRGKLISRGKAKRADYILYYKPKIPIAVIEAKDNKNTVGAGDLMNLCDELEAILIKSQADCDRLMEAAVADILAA